MQQVKNIMIREVEVCQPNDSIFTAALKMKQEGVGSIPISENNRVLGMVTDRDITIRGVAEKHTGSEPVKNIMTENIVTVHPDQPVSELESLFADQQVRRIPVVEQNNLVGIVTLGDLAVKHDRIDHIGNTLK